MLDFFKFKKITKKIVKKELKILFVGTSATPFAKDSGTADVMASLPLALRNLGQDVRIILPYYQSIDKKYKLETEIKDLKVPTDSEKTPFLVCNVKKYSGEESVPAYFLENEEYYGKRANIHGYSDDQIRWALLCRGVLEFLKHSKWIPDIIVPCNWRTGLIPNYLRTTYKEDPVLSKIASAFSMHCILYQGMQDFKFLQESEKDSGHEPIPDFFNPRLEKLNWLLRGILYSDTMITVSPTHAQEIQTKEYGEGLENLFKEKRNRLFGILNGIDYSYYDPKTSPYVPVNYSSLMVEKKKENKVYLQKHFGLPENENIFLIGMVSRLSEEKGFDLLEKIITPLLKNLALQMVFVGDGEPRYKELIKKKAERYPKKIAYNFEFDTILPHLVFAGSDAFLMPSRSDACGLTQMQAARYGSIPIVRKIGGLADTVKDFLPEKNQGIGFVFEKYDASALLMTITKAYASFGFKDSWKRMIKRAMEKDFSWEKSAKEYLYVFRLTLKYHSS